MELDLSKITAKDLLEKFGAGGHIPGSGSAVALQGMIACKLILTVISLTKDPKRGSRYSSFIPELIRIESEINHKIFPRLVELFYEDSKKFAEAISSRQKRDKARKGDSEDNIRTCRLYSIKAQEDLRLASDFVVEIAQLCKELSSYATYAFLNGFKSARGDSGAALSKSVSVIQGCIAILELNILSFEEIEMIENYKLQVDNLKSIYHKKYTDSLKLLEILSVEVDAKFAFKLELKKILDSISDESKLSDKKIEATTRLFQNALWKRHKGDGLLTQLDPKGALEVLGYDVFSKDSLGTFSDYDGLVETAGIIDKSNKTVQISDNFPAHTKKFTLAHELGHAFFHSGNILHRDRALDGKDQSLQRDFRERQADKFAAYFLMPTKLVQKLFLDLFGTDRIWIDQDTAFGLTGESTIKLKNRFKDIRSFSRFLASTTIFKNNSFTSLSEYFGVSTEAMAIRLEELNLFEY